MKLLFKVLLSALVLLLLGSVAGYFYMRKKFIPAPNQLVVSGLPATTNFTWLADTADGRAMPHAAVLLPVRVPGCSRTCYLQFDTGAPFTMLYARSLATLQRSYPALALASSADADTARNVRFALGGGQVQARWMRVKPFGATQLPADSTAPFIIGTLGTDVLEGRALVLDYPARLFSLAAQVPDTLAQRADFVPLAFDNRRVLLSLGLQGEAKPLLFDSGSSAFALITDQDTWKKMASPGAPTRTAEVGSMAKPITAHTVATGAGLTLGATALPLGTVTYVTGTNWQENLLMRFSGMGGMLGNEVFTQRTVIFDVAGGRFGMVRR
ncbi:MAG TPA: hypothetical protein VF629_18820 [Hymenobacter sp.]|jgi:hypothetical protein|uniref:hypothetical protein n=1 Tax=Hymenobacter sp. TaxID=1898978 RepID=UPI002ED7B7F1